MQIFNSREISIIVWGGLLLIWACTKSEMRNSLWSLVKQFFHYKILMPYLLGVLYTLIGVSLFDYLGWWTPAQAKDTLLWCFFAILSTMFELNKAREDKNYFKDAVKANFKLTLIIEFITGVYTFPLVFELFLVPIAALIGGMQAFAERDLKYQSVQKLLNGLLILFGIITIGYTIYEISIHVNEFASYDTVRDFFLSPILSLWFIPFLYLLSLYMTYEMNFAVMGFRMKDDKQLLRYAKLHALLRFNVNTRGFERWKKRLFVGSVTTKKEVVESIKEIKRLQKTEKNPPKVKAILGWSPYEAKDFLQSVGIQTGYYTNSYEDEWCALSIYIKLDEGFFSNDIAYYVSGNEKVATILKLVLNVHNPANEKSAIATLIDYSQILYFKATGYELPIEVNAALLHCSSIDTKGNDTTIKVEKITWETDEHKFTMRFSIIHKENKLDDY